MGRWGGVRGSVLLGDPNVDQSNTKSPPSRRGSHPTGRPDLHIQTPAPLGPTRIVTSSALPPLGPTFHDESRRGPGGPCRRGTVWGRNFTPAHPVCQKLFTPISSVSNARYFSRKILYVAPLKITYIWTHWCQHYILRSQWGSSERHG